jgi:putative Mn2+ efflux pump MntP
MKIGILLVTIGLIWLGARLGLLDFSWLQAVHFWPAGFILLGVWMVYKGFRQGKPKTIDSKTEEV